MEWEICKLEKGNQLVMLESLYAHVLAVVQEKTWNLKWVRKDSKRTLELK